MINKYDKLPIEDKALILSVIDAFVDKLQEIISDKAELRKLWGEITEELGIYTDCSSERRDESYDKVLKLFSDRAEASEYYELCEILKDIRDEQKG